MLAQCSKQKLSFYYYGWKNTLTRDSRVLVGLYILHQIENKFPLLNLGLYRDVGLGVTYGLPGPSRTRIMKDIAEVFKTNGPSITIDMGPKKAEFLDVVLDLETESYGPYRKPNSQPRYINMQSNHPPSVLKHVPASNQQKTVQNLEQQGKIRSVCRRLPAGIGEQRAQRRAEVWYKSQRKQHKQWSQKEEKQAAQHHLVESSILPNSEDTHWQKVSKLDS